VKLTIDINLQARVQAAMSPEVGLAVAQPWHRKTGTEANPTMPDGTPLNGAAVVLDVDTGEILAMVSTPSFSKKQLRERPEEIFGDEVNTPFVDRAIGKSYTPGSIVKPLMLTMAAKDGLFGIGETIECTGHLYPKQPKLARCWIYKQTDGVMTHQSQLGHPLSGQEAIEVSCNIFFFTLGQRLGVSGIVDAYRTYGLTEKFGLGVGPEFAGGVGRKNDGSDLKLPDAIQWFSISSRRPRQTA
jgi:cell division protein FtsI/penicillin-binding protein 2